MLQPLRQQQKETHMPEHTALLKDVDALGTLATTLLGLFETSNNTTVANDLKAIKKSFGTLEDLANEYDPSYLTDKSQNEKLKEYRHDLRAACGGIIGYSELILEDIEDDETADQTAIDTLNQLITKSQETLDTIELFKPQGQSTTDSAKSQVVKKTNNPAHVLIIDDNPDKLSMLQRRVEQIGHRVSSAHDGTSGLEAVKDLSPDIILLDLIMPDISGYDVLKQLKTSFQHRDIPVLMISSSSDMDHIISCIQEGADDFLPTPVNNTLLFSRIETCVTKKFARDRELKTMQELREARHTLSTAIESIDEGFAIFDSQERIVTFNSKFLDLYPATETLSLECSTYEDFLRANIAKGTYTVDRRQGANETDDSVIQNQQDEEWVTRMLSYHRHPEDPQNILLGDGRWIEIIENKIPGGGTVGIHKDVSDGKRREDRLKYLALHDPLTGLMNRKHFDQKLKEVHEVSATSKESYGLLFFDLDGFKAVNDNLGHDFGDFLLKEVAKKLSNCIRASDFLARLGGDEFTAIIADNCSLDDLQKIAQRCLDSIGTSVEKDGQVASFGVSIGLALYPDHGDTLDAVLKKADEAMYAAKKDGKGVFKIAQ